MVINVCCSFCLFLRSFFLHRQKSPESFSVTRRCCCVWSFQHRTFESSAWTQILLTAWNWCWKTNCSYALHLTFNMKMRISKTSVNSLVLTIYQRTRWHCKSFSALSLQTQVWTLFALLYHDLRQHPLQLIHYLRRHPLHWAAKQSAL